MTIATRSALPLTTKPFVPPRSEKLPSKRPKKMTGQVSNSQPEGAKDCNPRRKRKAFSINPGESMPPQDSLALIVHDNQSDAIQSKKRKRPVDWSDNAIGTMLALMKEYKVHNNGNINLSASQWREIMIKLQHPVDGLEDLRPMRNKWDKLQIKFRDEKDASERTGAEPSNWPWFEFMEDLKHGQTNEREIPDDFGPEAFEEAQMYTNEFMSQAFYETIGTEASFVEDDFINVDNSGTIPHSPIDTEKNSSKETSSAQKDNSGKETPSGCNLHEVSPRSAACNQPGVSGKPTTKRRSRVHIDEDIASGITKMANSFGENEARKLDFLKEDSERKRELIKELETMRSANSLKIAESMASMTQSICQMTKDTLLEIAKLASAKQSS